jgi:hypothetical protein
MGKFQSKRNYGWGKKIGWAGEQALDDYYGQGRHGTVATHTSHWSVFTKYLNEEHGIRDASDITQSVLEAYADMLSILVAEEIKDVAYCQNLLSGVNVTLEAMSGNSQIRIESPSEAVGRRLTSRTEPPTGYQWDQVREIADHLHRQGFLRARIVVLLCRHFGVRLREAVLADIAKWIKQAHKKNAIDIRQGTKGGRGREVERWVNVTYDGLCLLQEASLLVKSIGSTNNNLLQEKESYDDFVNCGEIHRARSHLHNFQVKGYHDLRSSWACERYEQITGIPAPVFKSEIQIDKKTDRNARLILAKELGHGDERVEVVSQYVGALK